MWLRELQAEVVRLTIDRDNWKDRAAELHESLADNRAIRARVTEAEVRENATGSRRCGRMRTSPA